MFAPEVDETPNKNESPQKFVRRISLLKAQAANASFKENFIIAADTILYARKTFFHKTEDENIAYENLQLLSGRRHSIYTGLTTIDKKNKMNFF